LLQKDSQTAIIKNGAVSCVASISHAENTPHVIATLTLVLHIGRYCRSGIKSKRNLVWVVEDRISDIGYDLMFKQLLSALLCSALLRSVLLLENIGDMQDV